MNADRALLAQYEAARNAKIAGEGLDYAQTNVYTREVSEPRGDDALLTFIAAPVRSISSALN